MADGPGGAPARDVLKEEGGPAAPNRDWLEWTALAVAAVLTLVVYPRLPERMAIHWNVAGQPDNWAPKAFAAWFSLGLAAATYLGMRVLPAIDPRRQNYWRFLGAYRLARQVIVLFLLGLHGMVLLTALGTPVAVDRIVPLGLGILFILLGNVMGQVRPNFFFGIRTPWTLADPEVWRRTHRFGARIFVAGGVLVILGALVGGSWAMAAVLIAAVGIALGTLVYSYLVWTRLQGRLGG